MSSSSPAPVRRKEKRRSRRRDTATSQLQRHSWPAESPSVAGRIRAKNDENIRWVRGNERADTRAEFLGDQRQHYCVSGNGGSVPGMASGSAAPRAQVPSRSARRQWLLSLATAFTGIGLLRSRYLCR